MPGTHNFLPFDSVNSNMTPDASYSTDANRLNGVTPGVADPLSFNKATHQGSIMAAAIAQIAANNGQSFDDTNLANLITALENVLATLSTTAYADRVAHALLGAADIGAISYCAAQGTPAAATYTASGTGNLLGGYHYREVLITGYNNPDGTHFVRGFAPAAQRGSYDVSPSSQQVSVTNLPVGTAGCIGRVIYRSAANGAAGSEKFCGIIWDNTTTVFIDNLVDSQLGAGIPSVQGASIPASVPTSNTTGTTAPIPTPAQIGLGEVNNTADSAKSVNYANTAGSAPANGGTAANTTSISSALTLVSGGTSPSGTLSPGTLWGGY